MKVSVIIATYNRPDALSLVIRSLLNQTAQPDEIIIADDGSTFETQALIKSLQKTSPIPIIHAWQPDKGFRLARVRNLGVSKSCKGFLIFLDGDCIPLPSFIERYKKLALKGWFCTGSRISLKKNLSKLIVTEQINLHQWTWYQWLFSRIKGQVKRLLPFISLPENSWWRYRNPKNWQKLRGCNLACFYQDYLVINGFDESFVGWGREDSDFAIRLINAGIKRKDGRFAVAVIHLWHTENDRSYLEKNDNQLQQTLKSKKFFADVGLKQHIQN